VSRLQQHATCPSTLQELIVLEQSRDRFTAHEVDNAAFLLGFGSNNDLKVDYDEDIPDDFVLEAWRDAVKRAWRNPTRGTELLRTLNNSLRILAEHRNSERLRTVWDTQKNAMSPERAYDTLEIPKDVDDEMVITVYNMRVGSFPSVGQRGAYYVVVGGDTLANREDARSDTCHCRSARQRPLEAVRNHRPRSYAFSFSLLALTNRLQRVLSLSLFVAIFLVV